MSYGLLIVYFLAECFNARKPLGRCVPRVHKLNMSNCVKKLMVQIKSFLLYMFFINSCLKTVLQLVSSSCNNNCIVLLFLKICPTMVKSHLRLVRTRKWCWPTPVPLKIYTFFLLGGGKSWRSVHFGELGTRLCWCSSVTVKGLSSSLMTFRDQATSK